LQIDCSVNNQAEPQTVECFGFLKSEIESRLNEQPITLGQAWMLSGWLPEHSNQTPKKLLKIVIKLSVKMAIGSEISRGRHIFGWQDFSALATAIFSQRSS
jgi:hypothetical protein